MHIICCVANVSQSSSTALLAKDQKTIAALLRDNASLKQQVENLKKRKHRVEDVDADEPDEPDDTEDAFPDY